MSKESIALDRHNVLFRRMNCEAHGVLSLYRSHKFPVFHFTGIGMQPIAKIGWRLAPYGPIFEKFPVIFPVFRESRQPGAPCYTC